MLARRRNRAGTTAAVGVALLALAVIVAMVLLWPRGDVARPGPIASGVVQAAEVVRISTEGCERYAGQGCRLAELVITDGPDANARSFLAMPGGPFAPVLEPGDRIRVSRNAVAAPLQPSPTSNLQPLAFVDFERGRPLLLLAIVFAALVVALGRWQGIRSLVGLAVALAVVVLFVLPALLDGRPPLATALVGGLAVMLATMALTHGIGLKSGAAMLGTAAALLLTALLALVAVELASITGFSSEEAILLLAQPDARISVTGLVVAGIVIAALGVLDDVTISQASTVLALRRANPGVGAHRLFRAAMAVGRDHLGATVNTLVLAYVGASLPVLLVFASQGTSFSDAINREVVAQEIVAMLVGSIGLVAAVPLTTGLAALLATRASDGSRLKDGPDSAAAEYDVEHGELAVVAAEHHERGDRE
jgi:uncharacterized membrane protein